MASFVASCPEGECEVLYGRAGYLYALCFVRRYLGPDAISSATLEAVCLQILQEGAANVAADPAQDPASWGLMYQWHYKQYLGGCHGIAGVSSHLLTCTQLVSYLKNASAKPAEDSQLFILGLAFDSIQSAPMFMALGQLVQLCSTASRASIIDIRWLVPGYI